METNKELEVIGRVTMTRKGYILTRYPDRAEKIRSFKTVEEENGLISILGLQDGEVLEEYLDVEGNKKRLVFREDMLRQIQEAYVCNCGGNMFYDDTEEYGNYLISYKCCNCGNIFKY